MPDIVSYNQLKLGFQDKINWKLVSDIYDFSIKYLDVGAIVACNVGIRYYSDLSPIIYDIVESKYTPDWVEYRIGDLLNKYSEVGLYYFINICAARSHTERCEFFDDIINRLGKKYKFNVADIPSGHSGKISLLP